MDHGFPFRVPSLLTRTQNAQPPQQQQPQPRVQQHPFQPHALVQHRAHGGGLLERTLLCGYPSKICTNERAWKRDGSQHRFCEEHRKRANTNQKRWAQRKAKAKVDKHSASQSPFMEQYQVDESMLKGQTPMDFTDFDLTLDALLSDAHFWSPTASVNKPAAQWDVVDATQFHNEDAMEAELWAALGLGNVNLSL